MFPIPSERSLSLLEVARYWARQIQPPAFPEELRTTMIRAWWRGELIAAKAPSRANLLRGLYRHCGDYIAFAIPDEEEPRTCRLLEDGSVEVFRRIRVPLPNADPDSWTHENCAEAFAAIAENWDEKFFSLISPPITGIALTRDEFMRWIRESKYERPTFWGEGADKKVRQQSVNTTSQTSETELPALPQEPAPRKRAKPMQYHIRRAVEALKKASEGPFPPPDMPIKERDRLIREWLKGDDEPVSPSTRSLRKFFNEPRD